MLVLHLDPFSQVVNLECHTGGSVFLGVLLVDLVEDF